ncbi:single-stranded-DNA-specific exonuclease RecJ [Anaerolineales bacterium HSG6]|nr:single-stranded-DNA-specific exonuclease RecJ [Anaerolineales bacterium HSG6]MDM8531403.1 single-stranded-DNA-specific exonuclease RecJ [Anaerolineales bacterium HSG25]
MQQQPKRWEVAPRASASHFAKFPNLPPLVVQVLYNRGIIDPLEAEQFISHHWGQDDPYTLKGMSAAVERLKQALVNQEQIVIYGDYDVDGVTSTVVVMQILQALGARVQPYIPNRFDEGYGLNKHALTELANQGTNLIITVDCGIRSVDEVAYANSLGLQMIITDHHSLADELPPAVAIVNPKQTDCSYPFKELAGVGLAYKLTQALLMSDIPNPQGIVAEDFLDLVALGTIADLVPLYKENRKLAGLGLRKLNDSLRPGLAALLQQSGSKATEITATTIGFVLGPRLNAAGRLDSALVAYKLLMEQNGRKALDLAEQLDSQNKERQKLTQETVEMVREAVLSDTSQSLLYFVHHPEFNPGIVGLAASRITEEFYRPALIAEQGPEVTKGSARSIAEFHITEALDECSDLLVRYGGHAAAAGFTVKNELVETLKTRLQEIALQKLECEELRPTISIDGEVNLRGVRSSLVQSINNLQPFGIGNPTPRFFSRNLRVKYCRAVGQEQRHLKLTLHDGKQDWSAIAFQQGHWIHTLTPAHSIDVVYNLEFNDWHGQRTMQLNVKDLRLGE